MFELEAIQAGKGDALLLHWGAKKNPRTILIDGGQDGPYPDNLRVRLAQLANGSPPLAIPLAVISHVDDDHIAGIIRLLQDIEQAGKAGSTPPVKIGELWHNGFHDLEVVSDLEDDLRKVIGKVAKPQSLALPKGGARSEAVIESYGQARTVMQMAEELGIPRNLAFDEGFVRDEGELELDGGLHLEVLCPNDDTLLKLGKEWAAAVEDLKEKDPHLKPASVNAAALTGALDDPSVPNQSSIVLLATYRKKTMLLTGDGRGDLLLAALRARGTATKANPFEVDVLKVAHHASAHTSSAKVYECIKADHYVVSGNGQHGNPHPTIVKILIAECLARDATLYLTNYPDPATAPKAFTKEARKSKKLLDDALATTALKLVCRSGSELGVTATV